MPLKRNVYRTAGEVASALSDADAPVEATGNARVRTPVVRGGSTLAKHGLDIADLQGMCDTVVAGTEKLPGDAKASLRPPMLFVAATPAVGMNALCVADDASKLILIGEALTMFVSAYARAAATYFLPAAPSTRRPSKYYAGAKGAVAAMLDQFAVSSTLVREPRISATTRQRRVAEVFTAYTTRFVISHEMAHVVLGHVRAPTAELRVGESDVLVWKASIDNELEADKLGLEMQITSLFDETQIVNGLSGAIYFLCATALLDTRLMLLAEIVEDVKGTWTVTRTHPQALHRVAMLAGAAERFRRGGYDGLLSLHQQLCVLNGAIVEAALERQTKALHETEQLLDWASRMTVSELERKGPPPAVEERIRALARTAPTGVLTALKRAIRLESVDRAATRDPQRRRAALAARLLASLPPECRALFERYVPGMLDDDRERQGAPT